VTTRRTIPVTLNLSPAMVTLLDVTAKHLARSRAETVEEGLRALFVALPRPDDVPHTRMDPEHTARLDAALSELERGRDAQH
jgi:hypothetical protein